MRRKLKKYEKRLKEEQKERKYLENKGPLSLTQEILIKLDQNKTEDIYLGF